MAETHAPQLGPQQDLPPATPELVASAAEYFADPPIPVIVIHDDLESEPTVLPQCAAATPPPDELDIDASSSLAIDHAVPEAERKRRRTSGCRPAGAANRESDLDKGPETPAEMDDWAIYIGL